MAKSKELFPLEEGDLPMCIYKIENNLTGKVYIGLTKNKAKYRWRGHIRQSETLNSSTVSLIAKALRKYGVSNFTFSVLDIAESIQQLSHKESFWISTLESLSPTGYNLTSGGDFPESPSEETREKHRKAAKERWGNLDNKYHTEEYKSGRREILEKFQRENPEHLKRAISIANNTGKPFTTEHCANISKSLLGRTASVEHRINYSRSAIKGFVIHCSSGEVYKSMLEASLATGVPNIRVTEIVNKRRPPLNGFNFWKVEIPTAHLTGSADSEMNSNNAA
jgi:group I intron endonuclease